MDENKNNPQLTPDEELDLLLEKFLAEEDPPLDVEEAPLPDIAEPVLPEQEADPACEEEIPAPEAFTQESLWENIDAETPAEPILEAVPSETVPEIGPDEQAMAAVGLSQIGDLSAETRVLTDEDLHNVAGSQAASEEEDLLSDEILQALQYTQTDIFKDDDFREVFGEGKALEEAFSPPPPPAEEPAPEEPVQEPAPEPEEPVPQDQEEPAAEDHPVRKRRPKNKHAYGMFSIPHLCAAVIWLVLIVGIGATLGRAIWLCAADILAFGRPDQTVYITITKDDDLDSVAAKLYRAGLVNYPELFKAYGKLTDLMEDISIGTYELNTFYDYHALGTAMSAKPSLRATVEVTIPEGYTCAQIFALLEEKGVCTAAALEEYACTSQFADYWFLEGTPRGEKYCLEGFLFPDTYEFYVNSDAREVYIKLLAAFDNRFTDTMKEKLNVLNNTLAEKMEKNGMDASQAAFYPITMREIVIIASLIEKETSGIEDDSYAISSVIYNRLTNAGKFPYLNIDAALLYATGSSTVTEADKAFDSPYNTYLYPGLIPGPISNPGRASLDAALDPLLTDYYYYVLNPETGTHDFSKTYEEHQQKVDKYSKVNAQ